MASCTCSSSSRADSINLDPLFASPARWMTGVLVVAAAAPAGSIVASSGRVAGRAPAPKSRSQKPINTSKIPVVILVNHRFYTSATPHRQAIVGDNVIGVCVYCRILVSADITLLT